MERYPLRYSCAGIIAHYFPDFDHKWGLAAKTACLAFPGGYYKPGLFIPAQWTPSCFGQPRHISDLFKSRLRQVIYATLALAVIIWFIRGPIYRWTDVDISEDSYQIEKRLVHYFAAYINSETSLSQEGRALLERIWPSQDPLPYDCYVMDTTVTRVSKEAVVDNSSDLHQVLAE